MDGEKKKCGGRFDGGGKATEVCVVVVVVVKGIKEKDSCVGGFCRGEVIEMWR